MESKTSQVGVHNMESTRMENPSSFRLSWIFLKTAQLVFVPSILRLTTDSLFNALIVASMPSDILSAFGRLKN